MIRNFTQVKGVQNYSADTIKCYFEKGYARKIIREKFVNKVSGMKLRS